MDFRVTFKNQKNQVNFVISFPSVFNRYAVAAFLQKSPDNVHHARKIPTQKKKPWQVLKKDAAFLKMEED